MDYQHITAAAGPETARRIEQESDSFIYTEVDPETLDDQTRGAVVLGMETIDYPLTDGMIIYLKRPAGDVIGLLLETDADEIENGLYDLLTTKTTTIQEGGT